MNNRVSRFDIKHNLETVVRRVNESGGPQVLPVSGAGYGLFADRVYQPDGRTVVTYYGGERVPPGSTGDYIVEVGKDYDIDGYAGFDVSTEKGRWINDTIPAEVNVRFERKGGRIRIVPIKRIEKGEQILWNYGPHYQRPWLMQRKCTTCSGNATLCEKNGGLIFCSVSCQMKFHSL